MTETQNTNSTSTSSDETQFKEAYLRLVPELQALKAEELLPINIEVTQAVLTAFGVVTEVRPYRDAIVKSLPDFDVARFDKLEDYAMALCYADGQQSAAASPDDDLKSQYEEALKLREVLLTDTQALVARGLLPTGCLKELSGTVGYKNVATDLQILAMVLTNNAAAIQGRCATQASELAQAFKLVSRILRALGLREQGPAVIAAAADMRARAFTQFSRAYDDARRAIIFLRWHEDDADTIIPSLYAGRGGRGKKAPADQSTTAAPVLVTPPTPVAPKPPTAAPGNTSVVEVGPFAV